MKHRTISSSTQYYFLKGLFTSESIEIVAVFASGSENEFGATEVALDNAEQSTSGFWKVFSFPKSVPRNMLVQWLKASCACGIAGNDETKFIIVHEDEETILSRLFQEMNITYERYRTLSETPFMIDGWGYLSEECPPVLYDKALDIEYCKNIPDEAIVFAYVNAILQLPDRSHSSGNPLWATTVPNLSNEKINWNSTRLFLSQMSYDSVQLPRLTDWDWTWQLPEEYKEVCSIIPSPRTELTKRLSKCFFAYGNLLKLWQDAFKAAGCEPASFSNVPKGLARVFPESAAELGRKWGIADAISNDDVDESLYEPEKAHACSRLQKSFGNKPLSQPKTPTRAETPPLTEQLAAAISISNELMPISLHILQASNTGQTHFLSAPSFISESTFYPDDTVEWVAITCPQAAPYVLPGLAFGCLRQRTGKYYRIAVLSGDWGKVSDLNIGRVARCLAEANVVHVCDMTGRFPNVPNTLESICVPDGDNRKKRWQIPEHGKRLEKRELETLLPYWADSYIKTSFGNSLADAFSPDFRPDGNLLKLLSLGKSTKTNFSLPEATPQEMRPLSGLFDGEDLPDSARCWGDSVDEFGEIAFLWKQVLLEHGFIFSVEILEDGHTHVDEKMSADLAEITGLAAAIDSYYAGVPITDIIGTGPSRKK